jgi:hypothetical protein
MPLGNIPSTNRLGISNSRAPNAQEFASAVLRLPVNILIYQQQLVRSRAWQMGPGIAAAEWCNEGVADGEIGNPTTMREISAHHSVFARRNLSDATYHNYVTHYPQQQNQLYYVLNEPELYSRAGNQLLACSCWDPPNWNVDGSVACIGASYWETNSEADLETCNELPPSTDNQ